MYLGDRWGPFSNTYDVFVKKYALLGCASECLSILKMDHCRFDYGLLLAIGRALPQLQVRS